jgi:transmembrane sensor
MQESNIEDLLAKYNAGIISPEEMVILESWYLKWEPKQQQVSHEELLSIKDEVWQAVTPRREFWLKRSKLTGIAASFFLLVFLSASAYLLWSRYSLNKQTVADPTHTFARAKGPDFKPGSSKATLTLENGRQILLKEAANGRIAQQGNIEVNKAADGKIIYGPLTGNIIHSSSTSAFNTMSTPRGGEYQLTLTDGTKVWLNAASSITFPIAFSKTERRVVVNGEAYFEVAHDASKPFIVSSGNQEITVLGTHFNVKAYDDDAGISTTLLVGSISIKNIKSGEKHLLVPGQQAKLFKDKDQINIKTVNTEDAISWKNGYFLFDNQEIKSIMKIMSRWYDVDIEYRNSNKHERFGGTFSRSSNMSEILNNLERIGNVHFKIEAKKVIVFD